MAKTEKITLLFLRDYSPRKKGEEVTFEGRDDIRIAQWYCANGIAEEKIPCPCVKDNSRCQECNDKAKPAEGSDVEDTTNTEEVKTKQSGRKKKED